MRPAPPSPFRMVQCVSSSAPECIASASVGRPPRSSSSLGIACSRAAIAAVHTKPGRIVVAPLNAPEAGAAEFAAHSGAVHDLSFAPFSGCLLATCSADGSVKLWNRDTDGEAGAMKATATMSMPTSSTPMFVRFHPCAADIAAVAGRRCTALVDAERGAIVAQADTHNALALAWDAPYGARITVVAADRSVHCGDLRTDATMHTATTLAFRPHTLLDDERSGDLLMVFGETDARTTVVAVYDQRKMNAPLFSEYLGAYSGAGMCVPVYDADSRLLALTSRGSAVVNVYDAGDAAIGAAALQHCCTYTSSAAVYGLCTAPKYTCDVLGAEVARVCTLTSAGVASVSLRVPRKSRAFHAPLFPDTLADCAAQSAQCFLRGQNASAIRASLRPDQPLFQRYHRWATLCPSNAASVAAAARDGSVSPEQALQSLEQNKSASRRSLEIKLKKSIFQNISGKELKSLDSHWYGVCRGESLPLGANILCNGSFWVTPWKTGGGVSSLALIGLNNKGRIPDKLPLLRAHACPLSAIAVSLIDTSALATGSFDAHVKVWKIGPSGLDHEITEPRLNFITAGKVTALCFHPLAQGVLATSSHGIEQIALQIWDVSGSCTAEPKLTMIGPREPVVDMAFDVPGNLLATASRDGQCHVYDPRATSSPLVSFQAQERLREARVLWLGESGCLATIGFAAFSLRQVSVWRILDAKSGDVLPTPKPVASEAIDQGNAAMLPYYDEDTGVLFVGGVGERTICFFEIDLKKEQIRKLGQYHCPEIVCGLAFLPKRFCDVKNVEICQALRLAEDNVKPVHFHVPRRRKEFFQDDIFCDTRDDQTALYSASEWLCAKRSSAKRIVRRSLRPAGMTDLSSAPEEVATQYQKRRLEFRQALKEEEDNPTMKEHIRSMLSAETTEQVAVTNRWDATPIASNDVDEDEWSD